MRIVMNIVGYKKYSFGDYGHHLDVLFKEKSMVKILLNKLIHGLME